MHHIGSTAALHTISLGAGVQSSVLALMATAKKIGPMPAAAIFADTGDEPQSVYRWLDWLEPQLAFPVIRTKHPSGFSLSQKSTMLRTSRKTGNTYLSPSLPVYTIDFNWKNGMMPRQCTRDFKIDLVRRETRRLMKLWGVHRSCQWIGISTDEMDRTKPSKIPGTTSVWPLIEIGMSRLDCIAWAAHAGFPEPPRSACVFCPYHCDQEWLRLRDDEPEAFEAAVAYEDRLRDAVTKATAIKAEDVFLHADRRPLVDVAFSLKRNKHLFGYECEGLCGI
jgi:hypothetical protein